MVIQLKECLMLKVLELFSGYGSQSLALEYLGIEHKSDISEIDTYAIKAYNQIHGETHNWGDITKIDETKLPYYDLITYSSPCQDFSVAGLGKGGDEGSGTRSSLLWECERIIRAVKPKYLLMENVKNLVGKAHKHNFLRWLRTLEMMGYQNFYQVLNAKDYGVPQNRERVFVVSILGCQQYLFPNPIKLTKRLKDVLERDVDEKYYLSEKILQGFLAHNEKHTKKGTGFIWKPKDTNGVASCLRANASLCPTDNTIYETQKPINEIDIVGSIKPENCTRIGNRDVVYNPEHIIGCLSATDYKQPKQILEPLKIREATKKGYAEAYDGDSVTLDKPNSETRRGRVVRQISNTLTTACNVGVVQVDIDKLKSENIRLKSLVEKTDFEQGKVLNMDLYNQSTNENISQCLTDPKHNTQVIFDGYRIRKLTPRECWRLMGVRDNDFNKLYDISNTQLYKMAGNSIVVDVLMGIFKNLFQSDDGTSGQLQLF
jgi:DNA (cytosine-5)-methyltransferase 1